MKFIRPAVLEIWKGRLLGGFGRFYRECVLMSNFTRQIRNQDHQIDQKKFIPLITSDVDTYLTLPLVYNGNCLLMKGEVQLPQTLLSLYIQSHIWNSLKHNQQDVAASNCQYG